MKKLQREDYLGSKAMGVSRSLVKSYLKAFSTQCFSDLQRRWLGGGGRRYRYHPELVIAAHQNVP